MVNTLYAKPVIDSEIEKLKERCSKLKDQGVVPTLRVVLVGENPASLIYTRNKKKFCEKVGADCEIITLPKEISERDFLGKVDQLNNDNNIHGILIQLPLPDSLSHINTTDLVAPKKDVDGFHSINIAKIYSGAKGNKELIPCTPKGILTMCDHYDISLEGKNVAIIGRSLIVGKPMSLLLSNHNSTVTMCHSRTVNLEEITKNSDIIITACGTPKKFGASYFRDDKTQIVFDVGITKIDSGAIVGDCDFDAVKDKVAAITPVPKGVGPMTIFSVTQNLLQACENNL